jgi:hypothetical protein
VLETGAATPGTLDLLRAQVDALGRAVGTTGPMVVQDLGAPTLECLSERADLFDLVALASDDGLVEQNPGLLGILGQVDIAHRLLTVNRPRLTLVGQPEMEHHFEADGVDTRR